MPIELIPDPAPGSAIPIARSKINEIIDAVNDIQATLADSGPAKTLWVTVDPSDLTILGQSLGIASVTGGGGSLRVNFTTPFPSAGAYAAVCNCTNVSGNVSGGGFASINAQTDSYVEFVFISDDGDGGTPSIATVIIAYSVSGEST